MSQSVPEQQTTLSFYGIPAAPGIAQGPVYLLEKTAFSVPRYSIQDREISSETQRFQLALKNTREQFYRIKERFCRYEGRDQIHILDSQMLILQDELLVQQTISEIEKSKINAEWALEKTLAKIEEAFSSVREEYFRERKNDVQDVGTKILRNLIGLKEDFLFKIPPHSIVVSYDFSPADTAQLIKFKIRGFITEVGGQTSHTAIIARALQVPAIVGCQKITEKIRAGDWVILNGNDGTLVVHPEEKEKQRYKGIQKKADEAEKILLKEIHLPTETKDHFRIRLSANMELREEMESIREHGAEGIGLYRTEFLFLNRIHPPSEEEQFENYKEILKTIYPHSVTIRTLDVGSDKFTPDFPSTSSLNPALGLRGIRLSLRERKLFRIQLRALLRASRFGKLRIMFPMISTLAEVKKIKQILQEVKQELEEEKIEYDPHLKLGVMIEVPAAVMIADHLAEEVDFFSIGTNDLIQYTLAVDRSDESVASLYRPLHPAILRMIQQVVKIAKQQKVEVGICGEMASEPLCILILTGLGLSDLSMNALSIPRAKKIIRSITFEEARKFADQVLKIRDEEELEETVKKEMERFL